jgi:hypothetical protein
MLPDKYTLKTYIEGFGAVDVRIIRDGDYSWCEGVEYDYGAQGDDHMEALRNFTIGLERTIELNKERGRSIDWIKKKMRWSGMTVKVPGPIVQRIEQFGPNE